MTTPTTLTNGLKYHLHLSGELIFYGDGADGNGQPDPLTPEQLSAIKTALMAPHPSGEPSGILDVALADGDTSHLYELNLTLTVDPAVFVGDIDWKETLEHVRTENELRFGYIDDEEEGKEAPAEVREERKRAEALVAEDVALESYMMQGPLEELAEIVQKALGKGYDYTAGGGSGPAYSPIGTPEGQA